MSKTCGVLAWSSPPVLFLSLSIYFSLSQSPPKVGSVTRDVEAAVKAAKGGQAQFRAGKNGVLHIGVGKVCVCARERVREGERAKIRQS